VAVVLSAQCTDKRVNEVTPALFRLARTPERMARLTVDAINVIVRPCGLAPFKAKAILGLSRILVEMHGGKVPRTFEELEALPGVGHKTASVVMSQAFGVPALPVDTHIHRLAKRWKLSSGRSVVQTERDLKRLFPESEWNALHLRIIYYGREHCTARGCDGHTCEICRTLSPRKR
jgi:endonuclease-3